MLVRSRLTLLMLLVVTSCRAPSSVSFHATIDIQHSQIAARRLNDILMTAEPIILYDSRTHVLNITLLRPEHIPSSNWRDSLFIHLQDGLNRPSRQYMRYLSCRREHACDADSLTICTLGQDISNESKYRFFDNFSRNVLNAGLPLLGVLYRQNGDHTTILVPLYDQCDQLVDSLTAAWQQVSGHPQERFTRVGE